MHVRLLFCTPPAHVTEHGPQGFHLDQLPSPANQDTRTKELDFRAGREIISFLLPVALDIS